MDLLLIIFWKGQLLKEYETNYEKDVQYERVSIQTDRAEDDTLAATLLPTAHPKAASFLFHSSQFDHDGVLRTQFCLRVWITCLRP